jgi:mycofactocin system glycosyltransferase
MTSLKTDTTDDLLLPLAYRLRASCRYQPLDGGGVALILGYPLRTALINAAWAPVLTRLEQKTWVSLDALHQAHPELPVDRIEGLMNNLCRKGYLDRRGLPPLDPAHTPTVSVIIPVRNRPEEIEACLAALSRLDYPAAKLEIIVVDDASEDTTPEVVARFPGVKLIRTPRRRQAAHCRNRAAGVASGDLLAFIDSDCVASATWLKELVPAFRDAAVGAVGGWVDAASQATLLDRYEKVKSALSISVWFKRSEKRERFFYLPTCNFLVRREIYLAAGGLRESLYVGEDVDLCWRLQDAGHLLEYLPMGRVAHKHRNRLMAFCARRFDYGTSEPVLQGLHPDRVKTFFMPWRAALFWLCVAAAVGLKTALPLILAVGILGDDGLGKYRKLRGRRVPILPREIYAAVLRGYLAFVDHCCHFISRYYLITIPGVLLISKPMAIVMMAMHLIAGMVELVVKKPPLNPLLFLIFFTFEQASYQSGVWWASLRRLSFRAVLPRIVHKRI